MKWTVFNYSINRQAIVLFNLFEHSSFLAYVKKAKKKSKGSRDVFAEKVKSELRYYFWSKSEYELIIEIADDGHVFLMPWCGCKEPEEAKIEVAFDLGIDWLAFAKEHIGKSREGKSAKIDVFDQAMVRFDEIVDDLWTEKKKGR